ncbi:hypothetical protein [Candidatus Phycosocius spiralis]|uniref:Uncharacterized protein n=1 Tax=Candidatus Phycosocius spiralis TaxID=2815099 RepID=A0ABQ4PUX7_9PROT|nr:hypothetical protein [Candidatus Phycosocius spiralis]GIU66825.1 hypothetical protein PsB1_0979 [Candidatus Phycosocius spiralis]
MKQELEFTVKNNEVSYLINGEKPAKELFNETGGYQGPDFDTVVIRDGETNASIRFQDVIRTNTIFNILDVTPPDYSYDRGNNVIFYLNNGEISFNDAIREGKRIQAWLDAAGFKPRVLPNPPLKCGTLEYLDLLHSETVPLDKVTALINPIFDMSTRSLCSSAGALPLSQGGRGAVTFAIYIAPNQWLTDNPPPVNTMNYRLELRLGTDPKAWLMNR